MSRQRQITCCTKGRSVASTSASPREGEMARDAATLRAKSNGPTVLSEPIVTSEEEQHNNLVNRPRMAGGDCDVSLCVPLQTTTGHSESQPSLVVFSGGTAFNSVAGSLRDLTTQCAHVLPVSDDGGSTAEIIRVLGGPAVGDIRSRCLRLAECSDAEGEAVRTLLGHRLPHDCPQKAKLEWCDIVEGESPLWNSVSEPYKHTIRAFLVHFHTNILRHSTERFDFSGGSVGNFFFAGARIFFRSLEAAIFLFSRVARIPEGSIVLPAVCTEERLSLAAELADGTVIRGQNQISHPGPISVPHENSHHPPTNAKVPCDVLKKCEQDLESPIRRVFYLSSEGDRTEHEVSPLPNPRILTHIQQADAIIYGMGSLYTSIAPSLILQGVGEAIAAKQVDKQEGSYSYLKKKKMIPKVLILNGALDREIGRCLHHEGPMTATDVVLSVTDALNRRYATRTSQLDHSPATYITTVIVPKGGPLQVSPSELAALGIHRIVEVDAVPSAAGDASRMMYCPESLVEALRNECYQGV